MKQLIKLSAPIYESARIKPAVVQVEAHPYLTEAELLEFCFINIFLIRIDSIILNEHIQNKAR
ncbi:MAG: hypothetical protein HWD61_11080 [Parachlamydiaceae bacterium]|nr:MAG: hypothetical protein HWD61_11080 [Parachlamydiaceae bacterium]